MDSEQLNESEAGQGFLCNSCLAMNYAVYLDLDCILHFIFASLFRDILPTI